MPDASPKLAAIATTKEQREILAHAIALDERVKAIRTARSKHAGREFRNYYCVAVGSDDEGEIAQLIELGLMERGATINDGRDYYVHATDAGIKEIMP